MFPKIFLPLLVSGFWILASQNTHALIDIDLDTLGDIWEGEHGFHIGPNPPANELPDADADGDGFTNFKESTAGTDPRNSEDFPRFSFSHIPPLYENDDGFSVLLDPPLSTLTWPTVPGKTYEPSPSEELVSWLYPAEAYIGAGISQTFDSETLLTDGSVPPRLFWRIGITDTDSDLDGLTDYEELHIRDPNNPGKTLDPFNPDSDGDGISDGIEYVPGTNGLAAFTNLLTTDPDGPGLPPSLATGLIGRWDLESVSQASSAGIYGTKDRYIDTTAAARHIIPVHSENHPGGMPSRASRTALQSYYIEPVVPGQPGTFVPGKSGYLGIPRTLLENRILYSVSLWADIEKDSITASRSRTALFTHHQRRTRPVPYQNRYTLNVHGMWIERLGDGTQIIRAGTYIYRNHVSNSNEGLVTPVEIFNGVTSAPYPSAYFDDGKYHHYAFVRADAIFTLYRDGIALGSASINVDPINAPGDPDTGISIGRFYGEPVERGLLVEYPIATIASFDRIRMWSRAITGAEASSLYKQDIDNDGLWDITENNTRKWDDLNGNAIVEPGEFKFVASPFHHDPPTTDHDHDNITSLREQNVTRTKIDNPDTDGDGLPDGFESDHPPLNPLVPNDGSADPDGDGLTTAEEYAGGVTNPHVSDAHLYPPTWISTERSLQYDFDDYGWQQPNAPKKLTTTATWPGANPSTENLLDMVSYNQLHTKLAQKQPFPGTFPTKGVSPDLEAEGTARSIPNPPCHHASLNHRRIIVKMGSTSTEAREYKAILLTERRVNGSVPTETVEDITLTIPPGQTKSNPYDLIPQFTGSSTSAGSGAYSETVQQTIINYEIKEVISDQIAGNEANKLPTAHYGGHPNNPMLMGTRMGRITKLQVAADVTPKYAPRIRIGAKTIGTPQILGSVATIAGGGTVPLTFNARNGSFTYEIVIGYDFNKNEIFDEDEIRGVFQKTPKTDKDGGAYSGGDANFAFLDKIIIVTRDDFKTARQTTENYAYNAVVTTYAPHGVTLLKFFSTGATTHTSTAPPVWGHILDANVIPSPQGLSHPLGAIWNAANTAETFKLTYPLTSGLAEKVVDSVGFKSLVDRIIISKKAALLPTATSAWQISAPLPYTDDAIDFAKTDNLKDMHLALGKCKAAGALQVKYRSAPGGKIEVSEAKCSGTISDLYDFAYGTKLEIPVFGIQVDLTKDAARAQAGHATLAAAPWGKAGRVFFTEALFDSGWKPLDNAIY